MIVNDTYDKPGQVFVPGKPSKPSLMTVEKARSLP
jgi:hypothetical protein